MREVEDRLKAELEIIKTEYEECKDCEEERNKVIDKFIDLGLSVYGNNNSDFEKHILINVLDNFTKNNINIIQDKCFVEKWNERIYPSINLNKPLTFREVLSLLLFICLVLGGMFLLFT